MKALASEKYDDFKEKYSSLGFKIGIATGDFDSFDPDLIRYDILIATAEKIDSLLRQKPDLLCSRLACIVIDEIHYIGDPHRGPTLETVITRLICSVPSLKILGLSATIANAHTIAHWLDAELITSTWRPVPLKEGVYCQGEVTFSDGTSKEIKLSDTDDAVAAIAIDCVNEKGQVLIFVNTRKSAQAEARRIANQFHKILTPEERIQLEKLSAELHKNSQETTKLSKQLAECLKNGVVFHHAGLEHSQRKLIEDNFRSNNIKVICATPTLAVGVNLPSRRTIIRSLHRYVSGAGMRPISVMEYKQMSGRAGRPKYDKFGEAILISRNKQEQGELFSGFIFAKAESIHSYLGNENSLRIHLLSLIVSGFIFSLESALEFIKKTFFSYQEQFYDLTQTLSSIIDFLEREEMIKTTHNKLLPTAFGSRISRLYIDPITAVIIRDCLKNSHIDLTPLTLLYIICSVPDMVTLALNKSDIEKVLPFADANKKAFDLNFSFNDDFSFHLAKIKTVWMIFQWTNEEKEEIICDNFGIGPGDVHRFVETTEWLLYAAIELAKLFKIPAHKSIYNLRTQIRYGIKAELIDLVSLKGIGRMRARNLFSKGFKNISELKNASLEQLQKVPNIGKELAQSIKNQLKETISEAT
ncbi:MAG: DEAD/DEAH box helicase [Candidatus Omnitrophica bacterium]|nr:DEAD/DEAH box helicase [Candidatus Omnitrophota bacterium]